MNVARGEAGMKHTEGELALETASAAGEITGFQASDDPQRPGLTGNRYLLFGMAP
jgi:hypothetical protein